MKEERHLICIDFEVDDLEKNLGEMMKDLEVIKMEEKPNEETKKKLKGFILKEEKSLDEIGEFEGIEVLIGKVDDKEKRKELKKKGITFFSENWKELKNYLELHLKNQKKLVKEKNLEELRERFKNVKTEEIITEKLEKKVKEAIEKGFEYASILLLSGSLNPPHHSHLKMFEIAKTEMNKKLKKAPVVFGYLSPSSDSYVKSKLQSEAYHLNSRLEMCSIVSSQTDWIDVLHWGHANSNYIAERMFFFT